MISEVDVYDHYEKMNQVVSYMLKGYDPTQIATELQMKRAQVVRYIDDWKSLAHNNNHIKERAKDAISGADQHYSMVINQLWKIVDEADQNMDLRMKKDALNSVASTEEKRINMLQKAGLLDNQEIQHQLAEQAKKQKMVTDLLREIASEHPEIRAKILARLQKITGEAQGVETT